VLAKPCWVKEGAKTVAEGPAQRQRGCEFDARGDLAHADIARTAVIMLETARHANVPTFHRRRREVYIGRDVVALQIDGLRGQHGDCALRADGGALSGKGAACRKDVAAIGIGCLVAHGRLIAFVAEFRPEGDVERLGQPKIDASPHIGIGDPLIEGGIEGMEAGRAAGPERGVERIFHAIVGMVPAKCAAHVPVPAMGRTFRAQQTLPIAVGKAAGGLDDIAVELGNVTGGIGQAIGLAIPDAADAESAIGIERHIAHGQFGIIGAVERLDLGQAAACQMAVAGGLARVGLAIDQRVDLHRGKARAEGIALMLKIEREMDEAIVGQGEAVIDPQLFVVAIGLAVVGVTRAAQHADPAGGSLFQHDVDDPCHRIRPILGGGAVAQDLDMVDGALGNFIKIDRIGPRRAAGGRQGDGGGMAPFAIDQHQHMRAAQAA
jgi:hypothetical protein